MSRHNNPMSIAGLTSGRQIRQAVRAVLSDSERVRETLDRVTPKKWTDPLDIWLYSPARKTS